jgi:DNA-binding NtrC family response regulator
MTRYDDESRNEKPDIIQKPPSLVHHFIERKSIELKLPGAPTLALGVIEQLTSYSWPGNVRELENVVERELILNRKGPLDFRDVLMKQEDHDRNESPIQEENFPTLDEVMKRHIHNALKHTNGRVHGPKGAAELLGINPSTLRSRMKKLGIDYVRRLRP